MQTIDVPLAAVEVQTADGETVTLGSLVDRPAVLVIPRYYGCLPCRGYLREVAARYDELETLGAGALGVSVGTDDQARWLMEEKGVGFALLVDPERHVYDALDLPRRWWVSLNPRGWWNYARAIFQGNRQGKIVEPNQLPGLAILDGAATAVRIHRGKALGDYPKFDAVLDELRSVAGR